MGVKITFSRTFEDFWGLTTIQRIFEMKRQNDGKGLELPFLYIKIKRGFQTSSKTSTTVYGLIGRNINARERCSCSFFSGTSFCTILKKLNSLAQNRSFGEYCFIYLTLYVTKQFSINFISFK